MNKVIVRKFVIWSLIIIVLLPNIVLGNIALKIGSVLVLILLVLWDNHASKSTKRYPVQNIKSRNTLSETVKTNPTKTGEPDTKLPASHQGARLKRLEDKAWWRLATVIYLAMSVFLTLAVTVSVADSNSCDRTSSIHISGRAEASRIAQQRLEYEKANTPECKSDALDIILPVVLVLSLAPVVEYLVYLGLKNAVEYVVYG